jgi:hypothetical protein
MKKFRLIAYDEVHDVWLLQQRRFLFFWKTWFSGPKSDLITIAKNHEWDVS